MTPTIDNENVLPGSGAAHGCGAPSEKFQKSDHPYDVGYWMRYDGKPKPRKSELREGWEECNKGNDSGSRSAAQRPKLSHAAKNMKEPKSEAANQDGSPALASAHG